MLQDLKNGFSTSEWLVLMLLVLPWACNQFGIDLFSTALLLGWHPNDADQVKMLVQQVQSSKAANSVWTPLIGGLYIGGRHLLKAQKLKLDALLAGKQS